MTRDELIAALESATEGSQELDVKVIAHLISGTAEYSEWAGIWYVCRGVGRHGDPRSWEPKLGWESALWRTLADRRGPTRSLDAAMMLFPDHTWFLMGAGKDTPEELLYGVWIIREHDTEDTLGKGEHEKSLPIAACIAALRARKEIADAL